MNERPHFFIKIYLTLYSWKVEGCCVWEMSWRQGRTAILTPSSSLPIAALLSHLVWVAQSWVTEGRKPLICRLILTLASYLQLTQTVCALIILLFNVHLFPLFFRLFTSLHWRLGRGSVYNNFWIMNAMCTFMYLFVVYFSSAPINYI